MALLSQGELVLGTLLGLWSNVSTVINAKLLLDKQHDYFAALMIFFLYLPGLVSSVSVLVLKWYGHEKLQAMATWKVAALALLLLTCGPIIPIGLNAYSLATGGQKRHVASLSRLFEAFLDDGPQFVLKLVVFVLYGVGTSAASKGDVVFTVSMATSFVSLVLNAIKFSERNTNTCPIKVLICAPMFASFAGSRAFTLAVFFKETLDDQHIASEWVGAVAVLAVCAAINVAGFRYCGQDVIRSVIFGLCSFLVPAGYNNDSYFYQLPGQSLLKRQNRAQTYAKDEDPAAAQSETMMMGWVKPQRQVPDEPISDNAAQAVQETPKMRGGLFLSIYTVSNLILCYSCAIYIYSTRDLSIEADEALTIPQILAVIPGCLFAFSRALLLPDLRPSCCRPALWACPRMCLASLSCVLAYLVLVPALSWSALYKLINSL